MPYTNATAYPRHYNSETHPIVGHIRIEAAQWSEFDRKVSDQTAATVLGHDEAGDDMIEAHVATTTADVLRRLTERWSA
jgi:hypothetical protein